MTVTGKTGSQIDFDNTVSNLLAVLVDMNFFFLSAAGLDKQDIAEFIIQEYPESVNSVDNEGRTPLHYAALLKDDGNMMHFLIEHGADESALDNKQKTAAYYKTRHSEIDSKLLNVIPDCPRSAKESLAANFDWNMLTSSPSMNWIQNGVKKAETLLHKSNDEESEHATNGHDGTENGTADEPVENGNHEPEETHEEQKEETPEASTDPEEPKEEPAPEKTEDEPEPEESKEEPEAEDAKEEPAPSSPAPAEPEHEPEPEQE
uniref:Eukaryotic translation initiation factor 5B-like n=1 Tax=Diabrotica virgifera virgifera TaxID=50390 RepID=A0A6P7GY99_DIAVI